MGDDVSHPRKGIHVGLIPDGNRRYAQEKGKPVWEGHRTGVKRIREFVQWSLEHPEIKKISIYALSTDNLQRSDIELDELWKIYQVELLRILEEPIIKENNVQIRILGDPGLWNPDIKDTVRTVINSTKHYSKNILNILLAYGSKFEITDAVKKMTDKPKEMLDRFLLEREPLQLVVRTGGQCRLSNFMLYQASYANIYFEPKLWPAVTKNDFEKWITWYYQQEDKFGK